MAPKDATVVDKGKAAVATSDNESKGKKGKKGAAAAPDIFLAKFRPKPRWGVYALFLAVSVSIVMFYDTCDVRKAKKDCGYPGVSALECRTSACFLKGGGEMEKKKITIKRQKGTKFGLVSGSKKEDSDVFIKSIKEGAIQDHNAGAVPEDQIYASDTITRIDGKTGASLRKSLSSTNTENVVIELTRSKLPSYLMWIHTGSKANFAEKLLTAPGTKAWFEAFTKLGGLGFAFWYMSGFPPASLPFYYFGTSGAIAWHMNRCCHDKDVAGGVPHCYKGGSAKFEVAMNRITEKGQKMLAKVQKNPRSYIDWLFWSPDFAIKKWL